MWIKKCKVYDKLIKRLLTKSQRRSIQIPLLSCLRRCCGRDRYHRRGRHHRRDVVVDVIINVGVVIIIVVIVITVLLSFVLLLITTNRIFNRCPCVLLKGMSYLHKSALVSHGSLSSSNCVINNRWVLKVTGFRSARVQGQRRPQQIKGGETSGWVVDRARTTPDGLQTSCRFPEGRRLQLRHNPTRNHLPNFPLFSVAIEFQWYAISNSNIS